MKLISVQVQNHRKQYIIFNTGSKICPECGGQMYYMDIYWVCPDCDFYMFD